MYWEALPIEDKRQLISWQAEQKQIDDGTQNPNAVLYVVWQ